MLSHLQLVHSQAQAATVADALQAGASVVRLQVITTKASMAAMSSEFLATEAILPHRWLTSASAMTVISRSSKTRHELNDKCVSLGSGYRSDRLRDGTHNDMLQLLPCAICVPPSCTAAQANTNTVHAALCPFVVHACLLGLSPA